MQMFQTRDGGIFKPVNASDVMLTPLIWLMRYFLMVPRRWRHTVAVVYMLSNHDKEMVSVETFSSL